LAALWKRFALLRRVRFAPLPRLAAFEPPGRSRAAAEARGVDDEPDTADALDEPRRRPELRPGRPIPRLGW
jgi:hypothetical protein